MFFLKVRYLKTASLCRNKGVVFVQPVVLPLKILKNLLTNKKKKLKLLFLNKLLTTKNPIQSPQKVKNSKFFFFFNRFLLIFLEHFFKKRFLFNFKKGTNRLVLRYISFRRFTYRYFKKSFGVSKQIIGILYYSFLLKDSSIFVNFFKKILEKANIKLHKKIFLGLKKLIKDLFKPIFNHLGLLGLFFNIKGKIGVSGNAKKRRYFFFFGKHSITTRTIRIDHKFVSVWTFTGALGFTFYLFF